MRFKLVIDQGFHFTTVEQGTTTEVHVPADTTRLHPGRMLSIVSSETAGMIYWIQLNREMIQGYSENNTDYIYAACHNRKRGGALRPDCSVGCETFSRCHVRPRAVYKWFGMYSVLQPTAARSEDYVLVYAQSTWAEQTTPAYIKIADADMPVTNVVWVGEDTTHGIFLGVVKYCSECTALRRLSSTDSCDFLPWLSLSL